MFRKILLSLEMYNVHFKHQKMKTLTSAILIATLLISSCTKNLCIGFKNGVLKDYTEMGGCGWIIELNDGTKIEPINLSDFDVKLEDGKEVSVRYKEEKNQASVCMLGKVVNLKCLKYK